MIFGLSEQTHRARVGSRPKLPNTLPFLRSDYMNLLDFREKKNLSRNPDTHFSSLSA